MEFNPTGRMNLLKTGLHGPLQLDWHVSEVLLGPDSIATMIRKQLVFVTAMLALLLLPVCAEGKRPPKPSADVLDSITKRGVLLAGYDTAAWHASDAVQVFNPEKEAVGRYIARSTENGWVVDFGKLDESFGVLGSRDR